MAVLRDCHLYGCDSRLSQSERNRTWEAAGLLDLLTGLEDGEPLTAQGPGPGTVARPDSPPGS